MIHLEPDMQLKYDSFKKQDETDGDSPSLNQPTRENGAENYSARVLNHWEKEGIINDLRKGGRGWRKYSIMDRVWIQLVQHLRSFGYPIVKIKVLKEALLDTSLFEFAVVETGICRNPLKLILSDGEDQPHYLMQKGSWKDKANTSVISLQVEIAGLLTSLYPHWTIEAEESLWDETMGATMQEEPAVKYRSKVFQYLNKK